MAKEKIEIDEELTKMLKQAKRKPKNFAVFASGTKCLKLIIDRKKISGALLTSTKKEVQAKKFYKGVCEGEGGPNMVFRVTEQPTVGLVKFRVYIQEATGMMIKPRFEIVEDIIEVDEIGDEDAGTDEDQKTEATDEDKQDAKGNQQQKKQLAKALTKVVPAVKSVLDAPQVDTGTKKILKVHVSELKTAVADNDMDSAKQVVGKIVPLVKSADSSAVASESHDSTQFERNWTEAKSIWQKASDKVDSQIVNLQNALKGSGDPDFEEIAARTDFGANVLTGNHKVRLMAAIRDVDGAQGDARERVLGNARDIVTAFLDHIQKNESVDVFEENPFGVDVTIRKTFGDALDQMHRALSSTNAE